MKKRKISCLLIVTMILSVLSGMQPGQSGAPVAKAECENSRNDGEWDTIYFGRYWQSDTNGDGVADQQDEKEAIRWRVLTTSGDYALLLSDKILDAGKFYARGDSASWEQSDVRNWLNTTFYREAFNSAEGEAIAVRTLRTAGNENTWGITTNSTKDKVYLLSYDDVCENNGYGFGSEPYNEENNTRIAATTEYAAAKPGMYAEAGSSDTWWLRNSGLTEETAYNVFSDGGIDPFHAAVNRISGIRPAIYVNLSDRSLWMEGEQVTAGELPAGATINETIGDGAGNLPVADRLPDWSSLSTGEPNPTASPSATQSPGEVPGGNSSVNLAHLGFTKRTEGGQVSENVGRHDYVFYCSRGVFSYLEQNKDGTYERVEACGDEIVVESYSGNFQLMGTKKIEKPLTAFGGYFSGESYKFIVFEQGNPNEDDSLEVLRVVKYDKDWNELDHCSISGINTTVPSVFGNLQMTETDGMLYIHTCHEMYKSSDGLNHQANMSFAIDQQSMAVTAKQSGVGGNSYVSHSFNQFITTDGTDIYRLDHGDAYPRAVVIGKSDKDLITKRRVAILSIGGETGANATGVAAGGFNMCGGNLVTVGNSVEQPDWTYYPSSQRNIFVSVTDTELNGISFNWLTAYQEGEYMEIGNPYLIPCSDGAYVMWEEKKSNEDEPLTKLVKLDKSGNKIGETHTIYARLSDCQPILTSEGQLVWYTTFGGAPVFYCLDTGRLAEYEHRGWGKMADCTVTLSQDTYEYSGAAGPYEPIPVVRYGDLLLEEGRDYTVLYRNNNSSGTATVVIKGHGFFEGEKEVAFTIAAPKPQATAAPKATAKPKKKTTSTTTSVRNRKTSYRTTTRSVTRYPGKVGGVKAKNNSRRALKINWKKTKNADYYEIQIARNRAFTRGKKKDTSYVRGTSFFRLKKNATYYIRVRAIGYSNGRNRYGTWSAVKKVKVRK